jgi:hypothetical protein
LSLLYVTLYAAPIHAGGSRTLALEDQKVDDGYVKSDVDDKKTSMRCEGTHRIEDLAARIKAARDAVKEDRKDVKAEAKAWVCAQSWCGNYRIHMQTQQLSNTNPCAFALHA